MRFHGFGRAAFIGAALALLAACAPPDVAGPATTVTLPQGGLMGLTAATLPTYLGQPSLKRSEPPAEIWQYAARDCLLFLFLYREDAGMTVKHLDARDRQRRPVSPELCVRRVAAEEAAKAAVRGN